MIRFGPSGNDAKFYAEGYNSSLDAPKWLSDMGLNALELNFGRGIRMKAETAKAIGDAARKYNISISVHAPYYINLASDDKAAVQKSYEYIAKCIEMLDLIDASDGANRVVIHTGSQKDLTRQVAVENCRKNLKWVADKLKQNGFKNFLLCIETMGRYKAIGTFTEIFDLCDIDDCIVPTVDFGHINAIEQGELQRNPERMVEIVEYMLSKIGNKPFHIHFQPTTFHEKGEHKHTNLADEKWAFPFEPLARVLKEKKLEPIIICESQLIMAQDALKLKKIYENI